MILNNDEAIGKHSCSTAPYLVQYPLSPSCSCIIERFVTQLFCSFLLFIYMPFWCAVGPSRRFSSFAGLLPFILLVATKTVAHLARPRQTVNAFAHYSSTSLLVRSTLLIL